MGPFDDDNLRRGFSSRSAEQPSAFALAPSRPAAALFALRLGRSTKRVSRLVFLVGLVQQGFQLIKLSRPKRLAIVDPLIGCGQRGGFQPTGEYHALV